MIKRNSNIVFYIFLVISISIVIIFLKFNEFFQKSEEYFIVAYVFLSIFVAFILKLFVAEIIYLKELQKKQFNKKLDTGDFTFIEEKKERKKDESDEIAVKFIKSIDVADTIEKFTENVLKNFAQVFEIVQGIFYLLDEKENIFKISNTFAFYSTETNKKFVVGEGINGQVVKNRKILIIDNVPENYVTVVSGLGEGTPKYLIFIPIILKDNVIGLIELASFVQFPENAEKIFSLIAQNLADLLQNYISFENK